MDGHDHDGIDGDDGIDDVGADRGDDAVDRPQAGGHDCAMTPRRVSGDVTLAACPECGAVAWFRSGHPIDPFDGMATAFGMFDLVATMPAVSAPGPEVMLYRAPRGTSGGLLSALPLRCWLRAAPGVAVSHDGRHLLVSAHEPMATRPRGA